MRVITSTATRIIPPGPSTGDAWIVLNIMTHCKYEASKAAIMLIVACMEEKDLQKACGTVASSLGLSVEEAVNSIYDLMVADIILCTSEANDDPKMRRFISVNQRWNSFGWCEAADYHYSSYDYQFIDASAEGSDAALKLMRTYGDTERDAARCKKYAQYEFELALPCPAAGLIGARLESVFDGEKHGGVLDFEALQKLLSISVGQIGAITPRWDGEPLLLRTSPSGGARHPTETYVCIFNISGIDAGWYHVQINPLKLVCLTRSGASDDDGRSCFPSLFDRARFKIQCALVLTCVFERNMYRYREPRTFRSVHIDAGHLAETFEAVSASLGIQSFGQYHANEERINSILHINHVVEGFMMCIGLG
jgi:SagB-type dehydrogenase family enzyme